MLQGVTKGIDRIGDKSYWCDSYLHKSNLSRKNRVKRRKIPKIGKKSHRNQKKEKFRKKINLFLAHSFQLLFLCLFHFDCFLPAHSRLLPFTTKYPWPTNIWSNFLNNQFDEQRLKMISPSCVLFPQKQLKYIHQWSLFLIKRSINTLVIYTSHRRKSLVWSGSNRLQVRLLNQPMSAKMFKIEIKKSCDLNESAYNLNSLVPKQ